MAARVLGETADMTAGVGAGVEEEPDGDCEEADGAHGQGGRLALQGRAAL